MLQLFWARHSFHNSDVESWDKSLFMCLGRQVSQLLIHSEDNFIIFPCIYLICIHSMSTQYTYNKYIQLIQTVNQTRIQALCRQLHISYFLGRNSWGEKKIIGWFKCRYLVGICCSVSVQLSKPTFRLKDHSNDLRRYFFIS